MGAHSREVGRYVGFEHARMRFASDDHQHRPVRHLNRWTSVRIRHQPLRRGVRASSARALAHTVRWRATHYGFIAPIAGTRSKLRARKTTNRAAWAANTLQAKASIGPPGETIHKRHRGDSNPCGQSPMDFESIFFTARTQCHGNSRTGCTPNGAKPTSRATAQQ